MCPRNADSHLIVVTRFSTVITNACCANAALLLVVNFCTVSVNPLTNFSNLTRRLFESTLVLDANGVSGVKECKSKASSKQLFALNEF